jgi:signal transduction histidine kinase
VDPARFGEVLTHLVQNAVKFSPMGGEVHLRLKEPSSEWVRIDVRDFGLGVPEEERRRIFDRFYKGAVHIPNDGMGVGLYLSREILRLHGGDLVAEFPPEGGTCMVATLPRE